MKILLADGSDRGIDSLKAAFAALNPQVEFAAADDFDRAIAMARHDRFSLVILGRDLPGLGGDRVAELTAATDAPVLFANAADPSAANDPFHVLTRREREVLERVADGLSNKDIARQLDLQEVTIKAHLRQVFRKLSVRNRTQAASLMLQTRKLV